MYFGVKQTAMRNAWACTAEDMVGGAAENKGVFGHLHDLRLLFKLQILRRPSSAGTVKKAVRHWAGLSTSAVLING